MQTVTVTGSDIPSDIPPSVICSPSVMSSPDMDSVMFSAVPFGVVPVSSPLQPARASAVAVPVAAMNCRRVELSDIAIVATRGA